VIYKALDTQYIFDRHDQKLIIFAFRAIFVSYCPLFWGSVEIYKEYVLERIDKKLVDFTFMAIFVNYCLQFWDSRVIYKAHDT
jgi:hypothetical protein